MRQTPSNNFKVLQNNDLECFEADRNMSAIFFRLLRLLDPTPSAPIGFLSDLRSLVVNRVAARDTPAPAAAALPNWAQLSELTEEPEYVFTQRTIANQPSQTVNNR